MLIGNFFSCSLIYCLNPGEVLQLKNSINDSVKTINASFDIESFISENYPFGVLGHPIWKSTKPKKPTKQKSEKEEEEMFKTEEQYMAFEAAQRQEFEEMQKHE